MRLIQAETIDFSLKPDQFSIGDLARHIPLIEVHVYIPIIKGASISYRGCDASFAPDLSRILGLYDLAEKELHEALDQLSDDDLRNKVKIPGGSISLYKWLQLILEHEIHHRAQIYQSLSHQGVDVPNLFGLSSEDLIEITKEN